MENLVAEGVCVRFLFLQYACQFAKKCCTDPSLNVPNILDFFGVSALNSAVEKGIKKEGKAP